jgi:hypothetical protein
MADHIVRTPAEIQQMLRAMQAWLDSQDIGKNERVALFATLVGEEVGDQAPCLIELLRGGEMAGQLVMASAIKRAVERGILR